MRFPSRDRKVLLVEDDLFVAALTEAMLRPHFDVSTRHDAAGALQILARWPPDILLLDLGLPDEDGLVLARQIRSRSTTPPIIFLTARNSPEDITAGLNLGGDDYVAKPFHPDELLARINAVLRRSVPGSTHGERVVLGSGEGQIGIDRDRRRVHLVSGQAIDFTRAEFDLLCAIANARGRVLTRGQLLDAIADSPDHDAGERVVDALVSRIRRKLIAAGTESKTVETVRGLGYRAATG